MPEYIDLCDHCFQHVIAESKHEVCTQFCKNGFHSGGGTYAETPEAQQAQMAATWFKHAMDQCCLKTCPEGHEEKHKEEKHNES